MKQLGYQLRRHNGLINVIFAALLIIEIVYLRDALSSLFTLGNLVAVLELSLIILLWFKWPLFKRILGEGRNEKRSGSRILFIILTFVIILLPLSLYILKSLSPEQVPTVANISIVALGLSLAGLSLRAASIGIDVNERMQFVCISQKSILVVILFVVFIPLIYLIDQPPFNGIYVDSLVWPPDTISVLRGLLFWIATPCYYFGIFLLWFGMNDFIVALANLSITSDKITDTKSSIIASVKPELRNKIAININTATPETLTSIKGINTRLVDAITRARPFNSIDDLLTIPGIGPTTLERLKDQGLIVSSADLSSEPSPET